MRNEFAAATFTAECKAAAAAQDARIAAAFAAVFADIEHQVLYGHLAQGCPCVCCQRLPKPSGLPTLEDRRRANAQRGLASQHVPERGSVFGGKSATYIIVDDIEAIADAARAAGKGSPILADAIRASIAASGIIRSPLSS